jgi:hypothetical protein
MITESINKWPYAYDENNNHVSIYDAINSKIKDWYALPDKQIKFINVFKGTKKDVHWRLSQESSFILNGVVYDYSNFIGESFEHKQFKGDVIKNKYLIYKHHKVYIKDARPEIVLNGSLFRADVKGKLIDGTDCIVEVIKTCDISDIKQEFINQNQILTFKIYIDDEGNQQHKRDTITGARDIEQLNTRIQNGRRALSDIRERIELQAKEYSTIECHRPAETTKYEDILQQLKIGMEEQRIRINEIKNYKP